MYKVHTPQIFCKIFALVELYAQKDYGCNLLTIFYRQECFESIFVCWFWQRGALVALLLSFEHVDRYRV